MGIDLLRRLATVALVAAASLAHAHGDDHAKAQAAAKAEQTAFGIAGDPAKATRRIAIDMTDQMRFIPSTLTVKRGETVRFALANKGATLHEMVLGTKAELARHAELMRKHPGMEHDDAHMAHVKPGATGEVVWRFNRSGTFQFACLIPGHFEAGMVGTITVK